jgi:hypothetical protein
MKKIIAIISLTLLTACKHGADIQYDYDDVRDECREFAEDNFNPYVAQYHRGAMLNGRDRSAILAKLFADCMYQKGWTVARPTGKKTSSVPPQSAPNPNFSPAQPAPPQYFIPSEPPRPATGMPIPSERYRINK